MNITIGSKKDALYLSRLLAKARLPVICEEVEMVTQRLYFLHDNPKKTRQTETI